MVFVLLLWLPRYVRIFTIVTAFRMPRDVGNENIVNLNSFTHRLKKLLINQQINYLEKQLICIKYLIKINILPCWCFGNISFLDDLNKKPLPTETNKPQLSGCQFCWQLYLSSAKNTITPDPLSVPLTYKSSGLSSVYGGLRFSSERLYTLGKPCKIILKLYFSISGSFLVKCS